MYIFEALNEYSSICKLDNLHKWTAYKSYMSKLQYDTKVVDISWIQAEI